MSQVYENDIFVTGIISAFKMILEIKAEEKTLDKIDSNNSNILITIPSDILKDSIEYCSKQLGEDMQISDYILIILKEYNKRYETQHLTTSSLRYNGRKPRRDVLEKLEKICSFLKSEKHFPYITEKILVPVIKTALGNLDQRTVENYVTCIKYFAEQKMGYSPRWSEEMNIEGLDDVIIKTLEENSISE